MPTANTTTTTTTKTNLLHTMKNNQLHHDPDSPRDDIQQQTNNTTRLPALEDKERLRQCNAAATARNAGTSSQRGHLAGPKLTVMTMVSNTVLLLILALLSLYLILPSTPQHFAYSFQPITTNSNGRIRNISPPPLPSSSFSTTNFNPTGGQQKVSISSRSSSYQLFMILPSLLNTENNNKNNRKNSKKNDKNDSNDDEDDDVVLKTDNERNDSATKTVGTTSSSTTDDQNQDEEDVDLENPQSKDFSAWMEGLTQWPRYPSSSSQPTSSSSSSNSNISQNSKDAKVGRGAFSTNVKDSSSAPRTISGNVGDKSESTPLQSSTNISNSTDEQDKNDFITNRRDKFPSDYNDRHSEKSKAAAAAAPRRSTQEDFTALLSRSSSAPSRYRGINPLSNFIKFEAILDLASSVSNDTEPYFNNIFSAADRLFQLSKQQAEEEGGQIGVLEALEFDPIELDGITKPTDETTTSTTVVADELGILDEVTDMINVTTVEDLLRREDLFGSLPFIDESTSQAMSNKDIVKDSRTNQNAIAQAAESLMKDTTTRIEYLVNEASSALSPDSVQDLILRASKVFESSTLSSKDTDAINKRIETVSNDIFQAVQRITRDGVVDTQFATDLAKEAAAMAAVANIVLGAGYAYGSRSGATGTEGTNPLLALQGQQQQQQQQQIQEGTSDAFDSENSRILEPLFVDFESAERIEPFEYDRTLLKGAEMGVLAGAIYEETFERCSKIGHSLVANGTTANVAWMVTDSIDFESRFMDPYDIEVENGGTDKPLLIRTITIRGFDASDETVDREAILNEICTATPEPLNEEMSNVLLHSGLLAVAKEIYADTKEYIDWMSPNHRLVLNGHSIGGSLSILLLLIIATEEGLGFVFDRILRVYTHGSPPVAALVERADDSSTEKHPCSILEAFGLPADIVYNYVQPYDPIVRLFTKYDPLYPLVDDLGADEITLYSTGPRRSLRPIARGIFQAWEGWPRFRDVWKGTSNQEYRSVGIQYLLLPDPLRYLNDRFLSVNVGVPSTEALVRISSDELLPALERLFPLDVFLISQVPQAVRSFLHHFYPAYDSTILNYANKVGKTPNKSGMVSSLSRNQYEAPASKKGDSNSEGQPSVPTGRITNVKKNSKAETDDNFQP
mmetsp:Transcript_8429/g.21020  ORF Transcript_8429/g.21020 Transcript_8429/m.21020 type:complete len:1135 (-) Transcript_8429:963-4367(-)